MSLDVITLGLAKSYTDHHGGGGGQVQPDWNQNDVSAPDYVKNRPFYTGDTVETLLLEETTATFAKKGDNYQTEISVDFSLEIGETYKVSWDGTVYSCVGYDFRGAVIGNQYILTSTSDTGEPFFAGVDSNNGNLIIITRDTSASHTISISKSDDKVKKIDGKYIPELYMDKVNPTGTGSFSLNRRANTTIGNYSFTEGSDTTASGDSSHAEGVSTTASGDNSHAEGMSTMASGLASHAEGYHTTASGDYSHAEGKYNIADTANKYAHIVGNGTSLTSRSNAHTLDWNGVGWFKDSVKVGGVSQDDSAAKTLATTDYVDTTVSTKISGKQDTLIQSGAAVGQIAKITAVDDSGKPTAWEAVDMPKSAYAAAQAGGYTDTQANFYADLAAMQGLASSLAEI